MTLTYKTLRNGIKRLVGRILYLFTNKNTKKEEKQKLPVEGLNFFGFVETKSAKTNMISEEIINTDHHG